jgi:chemotaxis protein CheX
MRTGATEAVRSPDSGTFTQKLGFRKPAIVPNYNRAPMTDTKTQITDSLVQDCIIKAVQSVFRTMMNQEVTFVSHAGPEYASTAATPTQIMGSVGFIGTANGLIYLCLSDEFAKYAAGRILGMTAAEVDMHGEEVIHDAIGEITNMTVGGFKNTLCDLGFPCKLTLPAIVRGNNLSIASIKMAARHVFHFDCKGHRITADIQIKSE